VFAQARFQIAFDRAQGSGLQIFAGVDRHRCAALSTLDTEMRADLSRLDASQFSEDAPQCPARHPSKQYRSSKRCVKATRHITARGHARAHGRPTSPQRAENDSVWLERASSTWAVTLCNPKCLLDDVWCTIDYKQVRPCRSFGLPLSLLPMPQRIDAESKSGGERLLR
jgi:hypothetical protein